MTEREKVIDDLEEQIAWIRDNDFHKFPGWGHAVLAMRDALTLLKAQEPRVMTLEEAKSVEGYVWLECCDTPILRVSLFHDGYYIEPFEEPFRVDLMNWSDYNKEWRYWTSCPTDEQKEKVKWE